MTQVTLSDQAAEALDEIAKLRGLSGPGAALEEAIGVEQTLAKEWKSGTDVVLVRRGTPTRQLVAPARS